MGIHLGEKVTERMKNQHLTNAELDRRLARNGGMYHIIRKPSIQTYLLWEISIALNYDFFALLSDLLAAQHPQMESPRQNTIATINNLQTENDQLRTERDYLKKMIDLLEVVKK